MRIIKITLEILVLGIFLFIVYNQLISNPDSTTHHESHSEIEESKSFQTSNNSEVINNQPSTINVEKLKNENLIMQGEVELEENRFALQEVYENKSRKYPLRLIQKIWEQSPQDPNQKNYLGERTMVADHLLIRLHNNADSQNFESRLKGLGYKIRKKTMSALYIVSFEFDSHDTLQQKQKQLKEWPEIRTISPDYINKTIR